MLRTGLVVFTFIGTFALRVRGITSSFWLLRDQMRDWEVVLGPFRDLPLVGPATHVGGYTVGPAFYWILWAIRVLVGPWFDNLPHAGGIGQAALQSAVDAVLLVAVWRRTGSAWMALAVVICLATAAFDLSLAGVIWNPVVGSTLAKGAVALVLLDWHKGSPARVGATAALAWAAVHAYTGAIYVAVGVFAAIVLDPLLRRSWPALRRNAAILCGVVALMQVPYVWYRLTARSEGAAMGAVRDSVARVVTGDASPEIRKSVTGLVHAVVNIEAGPFALPLAGFVLFAAGVVVAIRYRRDPALLSVIVVPPALAIAGYALFLSALDDYYYLSLMPSVVLMIALAATAYLPARAVRGAGIVLCAGVLALLPARLRYAAPMNRMPEYRALVRGSRVLARRGLPMRAVRVDFDLPPTGDPEYLYRILGGQVVRGARWMATIDRQGNVTYRDLEAS